MHFGVWVLPGEIPATVDFGISATAFGNDLGSGTGVALSNSFQYTNSAGADVYLSSFTFPSINLAAGTYYITLANGLTTNGGALFWDENDGPSVAFANSHTGPIGSESFAIDATPEPGTLLMLATGIAGIATTIRRVRL
jgi:PEP-CTERM motif